MFKSKKENKYLTEESVEVKTEEKPLANLTNTAYSILRHPKDGKYYVATIKFDPLTKQSSEVQLEETEGRDYAVERFKVLIVEEGMFE